MVNKKTLFFLVILSFITTNLFSDDLTFGNSCYADVKPSKIDGLQIESLSLEFLDNKKWVKKLFNIHKEFEKQKYKSKHKDWFPNFRIRDKYKKKFDARIFVKFIGYKKCHFKAQARVTGDLWWHLNWKKGSPISSLHIKLLDGNLYNVTQFKLFLKEARYGQNEVFIANLFKELGFISPKTFLINAKINNVDYEYIFQEDIRKELLESSFYREGPLLKGDERFTINLTDKERENFPVINFARVINKNFLKKSDSNSMAGLEALSNINKLHLYNHNYKLMSKIDIRSEEFYLFTDIFFSKKNSEKLNTFEALLYALDAGHGLSMDDRRFYYDTFNKSFLPIYYDGKSKILENEQITKLYKENDPSVSNEAILGAENALTKVKKLDLDKFLKILKKSGLNISSKQLKIIIKRIISRIDVIAVSKKKTDNTIEPSDEFFKISHDKEKFIRFIFTNYKKKQFYICNFNLNNCEVVETKCSEYYKILNDAINQEFEILKKKINSNEKMVFLFDNFFEEEKNFNFLNSDWKYLNEFETTKIFYKNMEISINNIDKIINAKQQNSDGKILFLGGKLDKWSVNFKGIVKDETIDIINNYDILNNLTGCVNFYEVEFNLTNITSLNGLCEDSINIVRSKGVINSVLANNSSSDALDVDFSHLLINNISVLNAFNDCVDFSSGNYRLGILNLKNCGDKALSVGEKSFVTLNEININNANMGIASKDSSVVNLKNANIKNLEICLSAYNKKQEYNGGFIYMDSFKCEDYTEKVYVDVISKIMHENKLLKNNKLKIITTK